jgi:hypothetical protein
VLKTALIASTAALSAAILSPSPTQRAEASAAASVTRANSMVSSLSTSYSSFNYPINLASIYLFSDKKMPKSMFAVDRIAQEIIASSNLLKTFLSRPPLMDDGIIVLKLQRELLQNPLQSWLIL